MSETYVPTSTVTALLAALDGTAGEYEAAVKAMTERKVELTERMVGQGDPVWPAKFWISETVPVGEEEDR